MMLVTRAFSRIASSSVVARFYLVFSPLFFRYHPSRFWILLFLVLLFFFTSFFSFFFFFYLSFDRFESLLVSRRVGFDASGKDRVMQRMRIVRWFEYLSLRFFFPSSFFLSMRREMCADVCDREESVVLITFRGKCPLPSFNLSFYLLLGFFQWCFCERKFPPPFLLSLFYIAILIIDL